MPTGFRIERHLIRVIEIALVMLALIPAAPLMLLIWLAVRLDDGAPAIFRQVRAGRYGAALIIHKFRTLSLNTPADTVVAEGDSRITRAGVLLRRYRLDELPQLFDVLAGNLALVGPRPETEADLGSLEPDLRGAFLAIKPGMTGPIQLQFIAEDAWLAQSNDPVHCYRDVLIPAKVAANLQAFAHRSVWADLLCLLQTATVLILPAARRRSLQSLEAWLPRTGR